MSEYQDENYGERYEDSQSESQSSFCIACDVKDDFAIGYREAIVLDGWTTVAPAVGQLIAFGIGADCRSYTIIESWLSGTGEQSIILDRPLEVALADNDEAFPDRFFWHPDGVVRLGPASQHSGERYEDSQSSFKATHTLPVLLEAKLGDRWCAIRIVRYPNVRAAINSLRLFAPQQGVPLDCVRVKALRSEAKLLAAEEAVIEYCSNGPFDNTHEEDE